MHVRTRAAAAASRRLLISVRDRSEPAAGSEWLTLLWEQPIPPPLSFFYALLLRTRTGAKTRIGLLLCLLTTFKLFKKSVNSPPRGRGLAVLPSGPARSPPSLWLTVKTTINEENTNIILSLLVCVCIENNPQCKSRYFTNRKTFSH